MQRESFFGVMRPRPKKQNAVKYVDMSALDKDLMVLKEGVRQQSPAERGITLYRNCLTLLNDISGRMLTLCRQFR